MIISMVLENIVFDLKANHVQEQQWHLISLWGFAISMSILVLVGIITQSGLPCKASEWLALAILPVILILFATFMTINMLSTEATTEQQPKQSQSQVQPEEKENLTIITLETPDGKTVDCVSEKTVNNSGESFEKIISCDWNTGVNK